MAEHKLEMRTSSPGEPMFDACMAAMETMREATEGVAGQFADPRDALTVIMTAASMFAGVQAGSLLAMGALRDQDKARTVAAAASNFRQGMTFGQRRALRIATDEFGGTA